MKEFENTQQFEITNLTADLKDGIILNLLIANSFEKPVRNYFKKETIFDYFL